MESEDFVSLSDAIIELINDEKKCVEYGLAGYKMVQDICNSKKMTENTLKIYKEAVSCKKL